MYPNRNEGYGRGILDTFLPASPLGKTFVVGANTLTNYLYAQRLFPSDKTGVVRLYTTIAAAIAVCTASVGDTIYVLPGHTETISSNTALTLSVAGVTIIGLGTGSLRPTLTLGTSTGARINVTAANVTVRNIIHVANLAAIVTCYLNNAGPEMRIEDCEFRDTASNKNFIAIVTTTVSVSADGFVFQRNRISMLGTTAATTPIKLLGTTDRVVINDNFITKAVLNNTSCLLAHGALVVTNLEMARNKIFSANTDSSGGALLITTSSTTNSGMVYDNKVQALDTAAELLVTAGSLYGMFNNLYDGDADASGFVSPAIGSTA